VLERVADLAHYTTAAAVTDLEAVREHLGYERINLAGGSYGTRLAPAWATDWACIDCPTHTIGR
jgi:pimeloyl-ACP methyl ester carboxylesterase